MSYLVNCINYSNHPNLLFIVKRRRNIDDKEIIKPNIIKGFDFSLTCLEVVLEDEDNLSSLFIVLKKNLLTLKLYLIDH